MAKIIKKVTLNAPASTSTTSTPSASSGQTGSGQTGVDPTKGTETNPYTYREYEDLFRANQWRGGYVEGHGYKGMYDIPDIVIYGDYYIGSGDNPFDDDDWDDDGINPHPNPSPDETGGNGGNYPPGGGGGNGTGGGNGNNGGGNGNGQNNTSKHHKYKYNRGMNLVEYKFTISEIDANYDIYEINGTEFKVEPNIFTTMKFIEVKDEFGEDNCNMRMDIENGTWKLFRFLQKEFNVEWQFLYNPKSFPNDETIGIIRSVFAERYVIAEPVKGYKSFLHSHPDYGKASPSDRVAAKQYQDEGYVFFVICYPNGTFSNYEPFTDFQIKDFQDHPYKYIDY